MTKRILLALAALALAACTSAPSPAPQQTSSIPTQPPIVLPTAANGQGPTPAPCAFSGLSGQVASDRLIDMAVTADVDVDTLSFRFAAPSAERPQGPAKMTVAIAQPPFHVGQSSEPKAVAGDTFVRVRFEGMTVANADGTSVYAGSADLAPLGPGIAEVVLEDASEGVLSCIVGYAQGACPTLDVTASQVSLLFTH